MDVTQMGRDEFGGGEAALLEEGAHFAEAEAVGHLRIRLADRMEAVATMTFSEARRCVVERVKAARRRPAAGTVALMEAAGRVLASDVRADRDYPPRARSMRDGFALRAEELPGEFVVVGEVRAGQRCEVEVGPGEAVEIMTGAMVPPGANAVVMVEQVRVEGARVIVDRVLEKGANVNAQGCDACAGEVVLRAGRRIGVAETALLATVGAVDVEVYERPRVAILATGDELVEMEGRPEPHQIRNSNSWSLALQVAQAGGEAELLGVAPDRLEATEELVGEALQSDLLLISGGVSAGKYDVVEQALARHGAEFYFDRVKLQPGQPCVFGRAGETFFFGLPGNPASTMVCFETLGRAALDLLSGCEEALLPVTRAPLAEPFRHKAGLTRFLPARLEEDGRLRPVKWSGSGDVPALARANCLLVADAEKEEYAAGEMIGVLVR
jgi:molybdopterin molybdotransferase